MTLYQISPTYRRFRIHDQLLFNVSSRCILKVQSTLLWTLRNHSFDIPNILRTPSVDGICPLLSFRLWDRMVLVLQARSRSAAFILLHFWSTWRLLTSACHTMSSYSLARLSLLYSVASLIFLPGSLSLCVLTRIKGIKSSGQT